MTPRENAIKLMDTGKSVVELAQELQKKFPGPTVASLWTMIDNMIKGRNYYPRYAKYLEKKYGFEFERPAKRSTRQILKAA